jgi:hypothetical protein
MRTSGSYKHIFVEHRLPDSYGVADEMARQLREMGYDASAGALTMMPPDAELIVSYEDMWTWDFNTYMIEIDAQVRTARGDKILAVGHYFRPSMVFGHPPCLDDPRAACQAVQARVIRTVVGLCVGAVAHHEEVVDGRRPGLVDEQRHSPRPRWRVVPVCIRLHLCSWHVAVLEPAPIALAGLGQKKAPPARAPEGQVFDQMIRAPAARVATRR